MRSVLVVVSVGQAHLDIVGVGDVVPVAGGRRDLLLVLDGYGHFDLHVLEGGPLFGDLLLDFCGDINLDWHFSRHRNLALLKNLHLNRHVDFDFFFTLQKINTTRYSLLTGMLFASYRNAITLY